MYILIISRGYPSEKYKMNGIFEFDQAKALTEAGHKVIYAGVDLRSFRRFRKWGYESFLKKGVQVEVLNIPCGRMPKILLDSVRSLAFRRLYMKVKSKYGEPDIIHAHFLSNGYATSRIFKDNKIPLVMTEHFSFMNKDILEPYLMKIGQYTYPRFDKVIAVSTSLSENIENHFGINSEVIPNIVDTENFQYLYENKKNNDFIFVSVGSLIEIKGMDLLIRAFSKVFKQNDKVKLYIYGEGPERKKLEEMIQQYNLINQVFLMGLVDRKIIADKMSESDCFVLPSKLETFGVAYIEAMAMGLPVIATFCGGPEDFVTEKNGVLIEKNDVDALAKAMKNMYENIELYDKKNISYTAKEKFDSQMIADRLNKVYKSIKKNH